MSNLSEERWPSGEEHRKIIYDKASEIAKEFKLWQKSSGYEVGANKGFTTWSKIKNLENGKLWHRRIMFLGLLNRKKIEHFSDMNVNNFDDIYKKFTKFQIDHGFEVGTGKGLSNFAKIHNLDYRRLFTVRAAYIKRNEKSKNLGDTHYV